MTKNEAAADALKKAEAERQAKRRGAARLNKAMRKVLAGMTPPDDLTVTQWAEAKRRLSAESAAEPGPWRTERTPYLREQTRTINPEYIVTLGNFSTKFILKTDVGITRLHGKLQQAGRFKVFPIFHPAAALYDGSKRVALEDDFATLGELLRQSEQEPSA